MGGGGGGGGGPTVRKTISPFFFILGANRTTTEGVGVTGRKRGGKGQLIKGPNEQKDQGVRGRGTLTIHGKKRRRNRNYNLSQGDVI